MLMCMQVQPAAPIPVHTSICLSVERFHVVVDTAMHARMHAVNTPATRTYTHWQMLVTAQAF